MRILVMFDFPMNTNEELRKYRKFRQFLIKEGFYMLQESIYTKMTLNSSVAEFVKERIRKNCNHEGNVLILMMTEKQFLDIEHIGKTKKTSVVNKDDRVIVI